MRSLRHELFSLASVLAVPAAVALFFPYEAVSFRATSVSAESPASAAFVTLSPEQESAALVAARTSWQTDAAARQHRHVRLSLGELPEGPTGPLLDVGTLMRPAASPEPVVYRPAGWQPSLGAERPARLIQEQETRTTPAFSREELLKLN